MNRLIGFVILCSALLSGCVSDETTFDAGLNDFCVHAPTGFTIHNVDSLDEALTSLYFKIDHPTHFDRYNYYMRKSWYYRVTGAWQTALIYSDSGLAELTPLRGVENQYIQTLNTRGVILRQNRMYDEALKQFYAAKVFTENTSNPCAETDIYLNLGTILYEKENYKEALGQYYWVINTLANCDPSTLNPYLYNLNSALNAVGLCHEKLGNYDSSFIYYHRSLTLLRKLGPNFPAEQEYVQAALGVTMGNLGLTCVLRGDFDTAEKILKESIFRNSQNQRLKEDVLYTKIKLVRLYVRAKEYAKAKRLISEIETKGYHTPITFMRLEDVKHDLFKEEGNIEEAYGAFILFLST